MRMPIVRKDGPPSDGSFHFPAQGDKWLAEPHLGEIVRLSLHHQANLQYMGLAHGSRGIATQTLVYRIASGSRAAAGLLFTPHTHCTSLVRVHSGTAGSDYLKV